MACVSSSSNRPGKTSTPSSISARSGWLPATGSRELIDMRSIDIDRTIATVEANRDVIVGLKVRASHVITGGWDLTPVKLGKKLGRILKLPIMVHVGEPPPLYDDVLGLLTEGDIVTHCFNGKAGGSILEDEDLYQLAEQAAARGIVLDVGHGGASFSFDVAKAALERGLPPQDHLDRPAQPLARRCGVGHGDDDVEAPVARHEDRRRGNRLDDGAAPRHRTGCGWAPGKGQAGGIHAVRCRRRGRDGEGFARCGKHPAPHVRTTPRDPRRRTHRRTSLRSAGAGWPASHMPVPIADGSHDRRDRARHHPVRPGSEDLVRDQARQRQGGRRRDFRPEAWPDTGRGRRIRFRQIGDQPLDHGAIVETWRDRRWKDPVPRPQGTGARPRDLRAEGFPQDPRPRDRHDLPGADDQPQPALHGRRPDRRDDRIARTGQPTARRAAGRSPC